ncbi:MAG: hypothetical protein O2954_01520, partial [bacterium]|nr:hypothetical protein [bacterium]
MMRGLYGSMLLIFLWSTCPYAQEIILDSDVGIGARATAMGGAYTTLSDDFSGLYSNPAGLARAKRGDVYTSFSHEKFRNKTEFFGTPAEDEFSSTRLNALGLVYVHPVRRGSLVFAGGYGRTRSLDFGLKIDGYDTAAQFHRTGFSEFHGTMEAYTVGGAVDVARGVSVGLSLQMWRGSDRFQQQLTSQDTRDAHGDTVRFYERFAFEDTYRALGLRAGLLYALPSGLRLGISITTPMTFDVKTKLEDEFEDEFENRTDTYPTERYSDQYTLRQPFEFALGTSWSNQNLTVAG